MGVGLQDVLVWTEPTHILTKYGKRWVRSWVIPQDFLEGFFIFWEKNKLKLKLQGYSIGKNNRGRWCLFEWQIRKGEFREMFGQDNQKVDPKTVIKESTLPTYDVKNPEGLRTWQVPAVSRLVASIQRNGAAIDGSDTGCGKTYCAVAVARELGMRIAVICPKAVISPWIKVIKKHFGMIPEFVLNYESVKSGKYKNIGKWVKVSKVSTRERFEWTAHKNTLIIFDESHRLKGLNTQNSEIAIAAKAQGYKILCCSATNCINPLELKAVGYILGLYKKGKWTAYLRENDCDQGRFGWQFNGDKTVLAKLHGDLFLERGIRLKREDIPGFPMCEIIAEAYDIDEASEGSIKKIYAEMDRELEMLRIKSKNTAEYKINAMVVQLRARQRSELIKVPLFVEMTEEAIEDGMSVAIFVNFSETINALTKRLNTKCIVWGENIGDERDKNIESFQEDRSRVIIVNTKAGGAGLSLHDLNGTYPRMSIISPTPSAVDLRQVLGRVWRDGSKSKAVQKVVFVANTAEEETCDRVKEKLEDLDVINDGELTIGKMF
jgi:superfamily II DNA or RNA helicase